MDLRPVVLGIALVACSSGGARSPAVPAAPAEGADSAEALGRAFVDAMDRGDGEAAARLFPSEATLRGMCEGDPTPLIAHIHGYRDREVVPGMQQMVNFDMTFVSVAVPAPGDVDNGRWAIEPGQSWLGPWNDAIEGHACRLTRPAEVVILDVTLMSGGGGTMEQATIEMTFLQVDGRWYVVSDSPMVPRQLTDDEVMRRMMEADEE